MSHNLNTRKFYNFARPGGRRAPEPAARPSNLSAVFDFLIKPISDQEFEYARVYLRDHRLSSTQMKSQRSFPYTVTEAALDTETGIVIEHRTATVIGIDDEHGPIQEIQKMKESILCSYKLNLEDVCTV
ncbi:hypothetical protein EVAR_64337_1 [Eumeta japonica]|uniref:Uncharacterized protein n=1 Tax=Eumeta variegata TaxID=151549 RepID=A0A4C1ZMD0_EUMVA|nr:hypothetical protein EVAR_64337_1 [Eumeta japonica]